MEKYTAVVKDVFRLMINNFFSEPLTFKNDRFKISPALVEDVPTTFEHVLTGVLTFQNGR